MWRRSGPDREAYRDRARSARSAGPPARRRASAAPAALRSPQRTRACRTRARRGRSSSAQQASEMTGSLFSPRRGIAKPLGLRYLKPNSSFCVAWGPGAMHQGGTDGGTLELAGRRGEIARRHAAHEPRGSLGVLCPQLRMIWMRKPTGNSNRTPIRPSCPRPNCPLSNSSWTLSHTCLAPAGRVHGPAVYGPTDSMSWSAPSPSEFDASATAERRSSRRVAAMLVIAFARPFRTSLIPARHRGSGISSFPPPMGTGRAAGSGLAPHRAAARSCAPFASEWNEAVTYEVAAISQRVPPVGPCLLWVQSEKSSTATLQPR